MPPCETAAAGKDRPRWEVADVFRSYGETYGRVHPCSPDQLEAMRAILTCRTDVLGGHVDRCDACGFERISYNSCRNRHCPKCQSMAKAAWLEARQAELLPVGYFHVVFTLPHELNALALANPKVLFDTLFGAAADTLLQFGHDPKHRLGGKIGFTALLHTWDQRLQFHAHLHCLLPGGALSEDGARWTGARDDFLFPVKALGKVFRGKYIALLKKAFDAGNLTWPHPDDSTHPKQRWRALVRALRKKPWIVYAKKPFAGPETVLDYLGRYTHRVAIANHRLHDVTPDAVTFFWRDRADGNRRKLLSLSPDEFLRRFLLHVLPFRFVRCRHYGFLASRSKGRDLPRCRELLHLPPDVPKPLSKPAAERFRELTGIDPNLCPQCQKGTLRPLAELQPRRPYPLPGFPPDPNPWDTS